MSKKTRILFLSANPWTTGRILVDEEEREIFEKLQEGPDRDRFELHRHAATRPTDLQRLLMIHEPHIVHFSGHGSKKQKIILGGKPGRGKQVDPDGLVQLFALYNSHVRLVVLNACFTRTQAQSLSEVIDYSVGAEQGIGDKEGVAFAGAFYRALGFGRSVKAAFASAKAELALTRMPRTKGLDLFIRNGVNENDSFPKSVRDFSRDGVEAGGWLADLSTNPSNDNYIIQRERALLCAERTEIAKPYILGFETLATGFSSQLIFAAERQSGNAQVSPLRTKTGVSQQNLLRLADKLSMSAFSKLPKTKRLERANSIQVENEIKPRSSTSSPRAYVVMTIKIHQVAMRESSGRLQTQAVRKHRAARAGARLENKEHHRRKRSNSESV
jgi:CHAT domain